MPELPEVETIARQLNIKLVGQTVSKLEILNEKSFSGELTQVMGSKILAVGRQGKTLIFRLDSGLLLLAHLKMTGQMIYQDGSTRVAGGHPSHDFHAELPNKHTRVIIVFDHSTLYFNDLRKFGWIRLVSAESASEYFAKYGPDAVPEINLQYFIGKAQRMTKTNIKKYILDQTVVAGVGNIYADEALYEAKIHPETLVSKMTKKQWGLLAKAIAEKLLFAIEKGGTTDNDYVNAFGQKGGMQDHLKVYHKTGTSCPRGCGATIERIRVAGRGTHYCPKCQKGVK